MWASESARTRVTAQLCHYCWGTLAMLFNLPLCQLLLGIRSGEYLFLKMIEEGKGVRYSADSKDSVVLIFLSFFFSNDKNNQCSL